MNATAQSAVGVLQQSRSRPKRVSKRPGKPGRFFCVAGCVAFWFFPGFAAMSSQCRRSVAGVETS